MNTNSLTRHLNGLVTRLLLSNMDEEDAIRELEGIINEHNNKTETDEDSPYTVEIFRTVTITDAETVEDAIEQAFNKEKMQVGSDGMRVLQNGNEILTD